MSEFANPAAGASGEAAAYTARLLALLGERDALDVLRRTPAQLRAAVNNLSAGQLGTPEGPGKWSAAQVLYHLADSELVGAFRFRMILAHDRPAIPGYDQDRWVERMHPQTRDIEAAVATALEQITLLRRANVSLFEGLSQADRARVGLHSERGEESLAHMERLYAAHDLVHLRQLERIGSRS